MGKRRISWPNKPVWIRRRGAKEHHADEHGPGTGVEPPTREPREPRLCRPSTAAGFIGASWAQLYRDYYERVSFPSSSAAGENELTVDTV